MPYVQLIPCLLKDHLIKLRALGPPPTSSFPDSDDNAWCDFHFGALDHDDKPLQGVEVQKVQDLLSTWPFVFIPSGLNIQVNPVPSAAKGVLTPSQRVLGSSHLPTFTHGISFPVVVAYSRS